MDLASIWIDTRMQPRIESKSFVKNGKPAKKIKQKKMFRHRWFYLIGHELFNLFRNLFHNFPYVIFPSDKYLEEQKLSECERKTSACFRRHYQIRYLTSSRHDRDSAIIYFCLFGGEVDTEIDSGQKLDCASSTL